MGGCGGGWAVGDGDVPVHRYRGVDASVAGGRGGDARGGGPPRRSAAVGRSPSTAGWCFRRMGDGMAAAFMSASSAVAAALDAQALLAGEAWPTVTPIRVRMGLHTGEAELRDGGLFRHGGEPGGPVDGGRPRRAGAVLVGDRRAGGGRCDAGGSGGAPAAGPGPADAGVPGGRGQVRAVAVVGRAAREPAVAGAARSWAARRSWPRSPRSWGRRGW